jgi:hypothetical protein
LDEPPRGNVIDPNDDRRPKRVDLRLGESLYSNPPEILPRKIFGFESSKSRRAQQGVSIQIWRIGSLWLNDSERAFDRWNSKQGVQGRLSDCSTADEIDFAKIDARKGHLLRCQLDSRAAGRGEKLFKNGGRRSEFTEAAHRNLVCLHGDEARSGKRAKWGRHPAPRTYII